MTSGSTPAPASTTGSSKVEFFARVHTPKGIEEVAIPTKYLSGEYAELIQRYVEWKQQEGEAMNLSFEQFVKVFGFVRGA